MALLLANFWYPSNKIEKSEVIKYFFENKIDYESTRNTKKCEETFSQKFLIETFA
ncbi:MAG: hypothetical protein H0A76_13495 [Candidatus Thiodubiliella endoseptemdiera]|uniref:Uncharacterized protein n=1 Tax=Candidatus Thiodubiliella endoseptemdiera TaxID=2738886 RepID=A0A853F535_9GAMM|nr:hypothetical protein [Candidatus Thiodubiliella endoseptemdiera]